MNLIRRKHKVTSGDEINHRSGITLLIIPHYSGRTIRIVLTPIRIYTVLFVIALSLSCLFSYCNSCKWIALNSTSSVAPSGDVASVVQTREVQLLQDELTKTKADLDALKQYVLSLGNIEKEVRQALKLGNSQGSLDAILNEVAGKQELQSYVNIPQTLATVKKEIADVSEQATQTDDTLQKLVNLASSFNTLKAQTPDYWPLQGTISSYFGWRDNPMGSGSEFHTGLDIVSYYGAPIRAAGDGKVTFAAWDSSGYGNMVIIYHRNGIESAYGHLSLISVNVGDKVKKGQVIGYEGYNGTTTGPHLHFEIRENGNPVNPLKYLQ